MHSLLPEITPHPRVARHDTNHPVSLEVGRGLNVVSRVIPSSEDDLDVGPVCQPAAAGTQC